LTEMVGPSLFQLLPSLRYLDMNLKPVFLFLLCHFEKYFSAAEQEQRERLLSEGEPERGREIEIRILEEKRRVLGAKMLLSLILWCQQSSTSDGAHHDSFKARPPLTPFPTEVVDALNQWNGLCVQSLFYSEAKHRLNHPSSDKKIPHFIHSRTEGEDLLSVCLSLCSLTFCRFSAGVIEIDPTLQSKQLLLESRSNIHRVPPFSDALSGHAYAFVASGLNVANINYYFSYPIDLLPILDLHNASISEKFGYLVQLIFTPAPISPRILDQYAVDYKIPKFKILKALRNIKKVVKNLRYASSLYFPTLFRKAEGRVGPFTLLVEKIEQWI
jgi:AraC-like DNA-binding protein